MGGMLVLAGAGAALLVALVEGAEGDFGDWPLWQAVAVPAAAFAVPAVLAAWLARRRGAVEAVAAAVGCVGLQLALVVGVGFVAFGFGPA
jgi:hypothetical protein